MAGAVHPPTTARKRASHTKSRRGCRNCKLRRVKCDETRPLCTKCASYGYSCNYAPNVPDLQMAYGGAATIQAATESARQPNSQVAATSLEKQDEILSLASGVPRGIPQPFVAVNDPSLDDDVESWQRLARFHVKTILTIGTVKTGAIFQDVALSLACGFPYLMHAAQTLTAIHDRHMSPYPTPAQTIVEAYHLSRSVTLFNQALCSPVRAEDRDALWATAAMLGIITFASTDATKPEDSWPLKQADGSDLDWIRIGDQKKTIWRLTEPARPDSLFRDSATEYFKSWYAANLSAQRGGLEGIPLQFARLFEIHAKSNASNNPYYGACLALGPLLFKECNRDDVVFFLSFQSHLDHRFRQLLEDKEPRALLLLAYWFATVCKSVWWIERRARVECRAIILYLERFHADNDELMKLLVFPKSRCRAPIQKLAGDWPVGRGWVSSLSTPEGC